MKTFHYIPILLVLLLSACTSEELISPPEPDGQGNVTFVFKTGSELNTRTVLSGSENQQHVEKVHLYIFSGTGDAATYVGTKEIPWPNPGDVSYATTERSYSIILAPGAYTFLAIGLDDKSGATYNLPAAVAAGSTLAAAKATLASGKTKTDIAQSELYAGYATAPNVQASGNAAVTINLWRRVAGVLAYIKNIPGNVATIQIKLWKNQYKDVPLRKADKDNKYDISDHGNTELADSRVLMSIPVNETTKNSTTVDDGHGNTVTKQAGSVLLGAFVLPVEASEQSTTCTLTLETLDTSGAVLKTYNVKVQKTTEDDGTTVDQIITNYPIYANHFYSIGKKNATIDEPIPLGEDIVIRVDPMWEDISDDIPLE